jgi:Sec-independent protein secretion pathway component TatC
MEDFTAYSVIGLLMFLIGLILGYLVMTEYYKRRFLIVAKESEKVDSIVPLISEMERET